MNLNPLVQQRELIAGTSLVRLESLSVIEITGVDRLTWLHNMLSQNILNLQVGDTAEALLLDPNGRIEADLHLIIVEERVWAVVATEKVEGLFAWFTKTKFRSQVQWRDASEEFELAGSWGKPVAAVYWQDPWPNTVAGGYRYGSETAEPWMYYENLIAIAEAAKMQQQSAWLKESALDALRIAAHRPSFAELDEKSLPHELDLLRTAVHLSKGCYRGQETVAKVHNLGHPPRRLVLLHLDGSEHELPEVGSEIVVAGTEAVKGRVTSAAQHFEMGPIALAVVSRSVPEDAPLKVLTAHGPIAANQEVIVPASAGQVVDRSKLTRKSLL
ncbi:MAG: hypothetical protein RL343_904 [Actinomycetota bacterium]|jgi:folate-binding protein YgfZ